MDERFVSLAAMILAPANSSASTIDVPQPQTVRTNDLTRPVRSEDGFAMSRADIAEELARLRLAARETFERAAARLLGALAHDVLMRELMTAPADINALAARALASLAECEPIGLAVAPSDVDVVRASLPIRSDATLAPGDLTVDVRDGSLVSRFTFRLQQAASLVLRDS